VPALAKADDLAVKIKIHQYKICTTFLICCRFQLTMVLAALASIAAIGVVAPKLMSMSISPSISVDCW